jgi:hypothetical protein
MSALFLLLATLLVQATPEGGASPAVDQEHKVPEASSYFAFADHEYIFTIEIIKAGVPILNFVSMSDEQRILMAKQVQFIIGDRKISGELFQVDTGNPAEPMMTPSFRIRPRSSFGATVKGGFENVKEFSGVSLQIGSEVFTLAALTGFDFENLVLKVNRINLDSPDFSDDWRVLKLDYLGTRAPARKARRER